MFYLEYYEIENYLFSKVHERFHEDGYLCAFDFFSIVRWKSNRPKRMIQDDLRKKRGPDLGEAVESLTREVREAKRNENRLKILMDVNGIGLAMASAILTVLYPDYFTVYDTRVCTQLGRFADLGSRRTPRSGMATKSFDGPFGKKPFEKGLRRVSGCGIWIDGYGRWMWLSN